MRSAPPALAVLRHALADPLSAATAKAEVLHARLLRDVPALATRARDLGADLATAGRLLDLLAALSDIEEEEPEPVPLGRLVAPFGAAAAGSGSGAVRARTASETEAIRHVLAFGAARGGVPRLAARWEPARAEIRFDGLGPLPEVPLDRLVLLPRDLPGADGLFLAYAAATADGGTLRFFAEEEGLVATLSWPVVVEEE